MARRMPPAGSSGGLLLHAMPNPHGLLAAAGMVKVIEQTWRLDPDGPPATARRGSGSDPRSTPAKCSRPVKARRG
jgi:hypothetical protein